VQAIDAAERRARLTRRHHLAPGHRAGDVVEAARSMVCLHETDPPTVYQSAWTRLEDMTVQELDRALYVDRSLVKHLAMRRTLFVFPRETMGIAQAGASYRVADGERRTLIRDVEKAGPASGRRALARGGVGGGVGGADRRAGGHVVRAARRDPLACRLDHLRGREVLGWAVAGRSASVDHAVRSRANRTRVERRPGGPRRGPGGRPRRPGSGRSSPPTHQQPGWQGSSSSGCARSAPARRPTSSGGSGRPSQLYAPH